MIYYGHVKKMSKKIDSLQATSVRTGNNGAEEKRKIQKIMEIKKKYIGKWGITSSDAKAERNGGKVPKLESSDRLLN